MYVLHQPSSTLLQKVYCHIAMVIFVSATGLYSSKLLADENICGFNLEGRFVESAPRDSFIFSNQSDAAWNIESIRIDLTSSAGKLLFDTTGSGAGVEVFQPFQLVLSADTASTVTLSSTPNPVDGDQDMRLEFSTFPQASEFSFTIDVDDQLNDSELGQIRVSGGEIMGSVLTVVVNRAGTEKSTLEGVYSANSRVLIASEDC